MFKKLTKRFEVMRERGRFRIFNRRKAQNQTRQGALDYAFTAQFSALTGTARHCYVHPDVAAVAIERNQHDKSYRRPVCSECAV